MPGFGCCRNQRMLSSDLLFPSRGLCLSRQGASRDDRRSPLRHGRRTHIGQRILLLRLLCRSRVIHSEIDVLAVVGRTTAHVSGLIYLDGFRSGVRTCLVDGYEVTGRKQSAKQVLNHASWRCLPWKTQVAREYPADGRPRTTDRLKCFQTAVCRLTEKQQVRRNVSGNCD